MCTSYRRNNSKNSKSISNINYLVPLRYVDRVKVSGEIASKTARTIFVLNSRHPFPVFRSCIVHAFHENAGGETGRGINGVLGPLVTTN